MEIKASAPLPATRINSVAALATPAEIAEYTPTGSTRALAGALAQGNLGNSFADLAEKAGIARATLYEIIENPAACSWISAQLTGQTARCLGLVHARLFYLAMTSKSPAALELYLKRFDSEYKRDLQEVKDVAKTINSQLNFISTMSPQELANFVNLKRRRVLGAQAEILDAEGQDASPAQ